MFTTGLREPLRTDVELVALSDLQATMRLARAYDRCLVMSKMGAKQTTSTTKSTVLSVMVTSTSRPRFRHLSLEVLAAKQANDECYH
jgi:hypothetical protein